MFDRLTRLLGHRSWLIVVDWEGHAAELFAHITFEDFIETGPLRWVLQPRQFIALQMLTILVECTSVFCLVVLFAHHI